ncbi:MAG: hypothetical protein ACI8Q1_000138 [Parvicella sp.]|jgi:hypothetical protein
MNIVSKITLIALGTTILLSNCRKGCTDPEANNYDEKAKKNDESCTYDADESYAVPSTYIFTDAAGNNTVSFSGQYARLDMLSEMATYLKTSNTAGTSVSLTTLQAMYANNTYTWTDVNALGMTGSTKQLKDKTAFFSADGSPDAGIQIWIEDYMDSLASLSALTVTGAESGTSGTAGVWPNDGTKGPYLMSANGVEYMQIIEKTLMSAVFASQITVNYLGTLYNDDNATASDAAAGKYYTEMEHHWDEAYGYFTTEISFPSSGTDRFWGKYSDGREGILSSATIISEAFRKGRAAISNTDYTERDAQIVIIRTELEKVQAGTAIHYLNEAKSNISANTTRNHVLSEAYAFVNGIRFGYNSINGMSITAAEIDQVLSYMGNDFNNITIIDINNAIDLLASKTGLTSVKDNL